MIVTLDSKRRLTVPSALATTQPGEHFQVDFDAEEDAIIYRRIATEPDWIDVIADCPAPMDDLPVRRAEYFKSKL